MSPPEESEIRSAVESFLRQDSPNHEALVCVQLTPEDTDDAQALPSSEISNTVPRDAFPTDVVQKKTAASVVLESLQDTKFRGILTLLQLHAWTAVSLVVTRRTTDAKPLPTHLIQATQQIWDGYCGSNRQCDGEAMARVFHPLCRLVFAREAEISIYTQPEFVDKVNRRYEIQPHQDYASYRSISGQYDELLAVHLVAPHLALVVLKIGHPPCLWTDLLVCGIAKGNRWWVIHKSSCMEPFPGV